MINQYEFIHKYVDKKINKFNADLFTRSDEAIIDQVEKIILSCQTEGEVFSIKVTKFTVINDYFEIQQKLRDYYDAALKTKKSSNHSIDENRYNFIDLKSSDIRLLVVYYHISAKDEEADCEVIIELPRVVKKFYFYINGNYYFPMYQIVDSSTYNNNTLSADNIQNKTIDGDKTKGSYVTFKTNKNPIRVYCNLYTMYDTRGNEHVLTNYSCNIFSKSTPTIMYLFAKYGINETLGRLGLSEYVYISNNDIDDDYTCSFAPSSRNSTSSPIRISVPKSIIDRNYILQHILYTIMSSIKQDTTVNDLYTKEFWISRVGECFSTSSNSLIKGMSVLFSLESVLDVNIQEQLHLDWKYKKDIYSILVWIICEYSELHSKDNADILEKKIRCAEYIATAYGVKLSSGIYRLCSLGKRVNLKDVKKIIYTKPEYILSEISTKSHLINFKNIVNDMDSFLPIKYTYKGINGLGNSSKYVSEQFRFIHISSLGILDPDSSTATDPGMTGSIVPSLRLYNNGHFSNRPETLTWKDELAKLNRDYDNARGLIEVLEFKRNNLGDTSISDKDLSVAKQAYSAASNVLDTMAEYSETAQEIINKRLDAITGRPLEGSGLIYYE